MNTGYINFWCYAARYRTDCENDVRYIIRKGLCPKCKEDEENRKLTETLKGVWTSESSGSGRGHIGENR